MKYRKPARFNVNPEPPLYNEGPVTRLDGPCIYFLQFVGKGNESGLIKIGFTTRLYLRRLEIAAEVNANPDWFVCLGTIPGDFGVEDFFHNHFDEFNVFSEWFKPEFKPPPFITWRYYQ